MVLGIICLLRPEKQEAGAVDKEALSSIKKVFIVLFIYCLGISWAGYLAGTFAAGVLLFKIIGAFRIHAAIFFSALLTGGLYGVFIVLLGIRFPTGILG